MTGLSGFSMTICILSRTYFSGFFRLIIALSWVVFSFVHVSAWAGEARVVRIGYYDNPPKLYRDQQGVPKGIFPEILAVIAKEENWRLEWVPGTWLQGLNNLKSGRIDIMPDVAYSLKKAGVYDFSDEAVFVNWGTLYTRPGIHVDNIPDLAGKRVAVMRGSIHTDGEEGIRNQVKKFNTSCRFIEFDNYQNVFQALQNDLADVGVVNRLFGTTTQQLYDVLPTTVVFNPRHLKFAFPKNKPSTASLKATIDRYLKEAHQNPDSAITHIVNSYVSDISMRLKAEEQQVYLTDSEKAWIKAHPTIRVGIDPEFAPFEYIDDNGNYSGFAADYINLLNKRLGLHIEVMFGLSWQEVMRRAKTKEIDMLSAVGFSEKRSRFLSYSIPYLGFYRMVFCRSDAPFISGVPDLAKLNIAVQANTSHAAWIQEHTNLKPHYYDTLKETILAVSRGGDDAFIGNLAVCTYWIRKLNITNLRVAAPVSLERQLLYMAVRKDWTPLVGILNKGIRSISPRGAEIIRNRWLAAGYSVGVSRRIIYQRLALILFVSLFVISFFWFWNTRLKREIVRRKEAESALLDIQGKLVQKVAERTRKLEENKNYLQAIFNAPNEAIFIHDSETGAILDVNQTMLEMYGLTYKEALRARVSDLSLDEHPYDEEEAIRWIRRTLTKGPQTFEWLSRKKSGELFWTEVGLTLTKVAARAYIIAVVRNIDEKKRNEQILLAEQERLAVTLRSIGEGVIAVDMQGGVVLVNRVAEKLTGWTFDEARGLPYSKVFIVVDETTGKRVEDPVDMAFRRRAVVGFRHHAVLQAKDGTMRSIAYSCAPIRDRDSQVIGVVLVFRDVSNERKIEEELLKIRKLESLGVLAGGIAHDFNNILAAIFGNIELTKKLAGSDGKMASLLDDALKACGRAGELTRQLLTFARGGEPIRETASLAQLIRDSAEFVLHGSQVSCSYNFPENLWLVDVDKGQISQVIQNIIINARQAMVEGGMVRIECANVKNGLVEAFPGMSEKKYVKIVLSDAGTGIHPEIIDKIFDPFFTTKEKGSGLGLAICHSIIIRHQGRIFVESTPNVGTTFTIYLPASDAGKESMKGMDRKKHNGGQPQPARIMVMDDEDLVKKVVKSQLEYLGHEVLFVADGSEAVGRYRERMGTDKKIDCIIMDLTIPGGVGGKEAVQDILAIDPDARVIVASGYFNDPVMANYREYGFMAAVSKPFNLDELQQAIASVLA